jgi:hypothetical protein
MRAAAARPNARARGTVREEELRAGSPRMVSQTRNNQRTAPTPNGACNYRVIATSTVCESLRKAWFCQMFTAAELRFRQALWHTILDRLLHFLPLIRISSHDAGPLAVQCDSQAGPGSDDAGPGSRVHVGTNAAAAEISDQQERARTDASSQPAAQNVRIGQDWAGLASRPALRQVGLRQTDIRLLPSYDCSRTQSREERSRRAFLHWDGPGITLRPGSWTGRASSSHSSGWI